MSGALYFGWVAKRKFVQLSLTSKPILRISSVRRVLVAIIFATVSLKYFSSATEAQPASMATLSMGYELYESFAALRAAISSAPAAQ